MPKRYRVGVIGSTGRGNYGHGLDTAWFDVPSTQVVAVADDNPEGLAKATERLKVNTAFADYRDMLAKVELDIVAICPRWLDQHKDMAIAAAERGVHIYMEKPLCRTLAEADEIIDACERTHVKLMVAHPTHFSPKLDIVKRLIADGALGQVLEYRARGKEDRRGGGEDLWVLGTHMLDLMRAIGGHPEWCFAHVTQNGAAITRRNVVDGPEGLGLLAGDAVRAMYGVSDGSTMYFHSYRNAAAPGPRRYGLQIFGTKGVIEIVEGTLPSVKYLSDPSWSPGRSGAQWQDVSSAGIGKPESLKGKRYEARHLLAIDEFLKAIEENREPKSNMYQARGVVEMIAGTFESHRQKKPVSFPLENRDNPLSML